jgi:peptide/nickel transport system substrate-binding protein
MTASDTGACMDNRFTLKDFIFIVLLILVIAIVIFTGWKFSYQESRINDVRSQIQRLDETQKQELTTLQEIRNALRSGVSVSGNATGPARSERIRQKNPDGSQYIYFPDIPTSPRDPAKLPGYATGDWLVKNIGGEPRSLTPFVTNDMAGAIAQGAALESLVTRNPDTMEWEPSLADKLWISADGLKFKFHLRPQACFSDGVKMTADDVLFSYNTIMNPEVDCEPLRGYYDKVKSCTKIDDETVEFAMSEPYFLALDFVGGMSIIPQHIYKFQKGDEFNKNIDVLVGSGSYRLEKWEKGQKITFVRNEKYWGDRPALDRFVYVFIGNAQSQMESFLKEEVDELSEPIEPDPEEYIRYEHDPNFLKRFIPYKYSRPNAMSMHIGYNMNKPMFREKKTRIALTMLIDRKGIIDEFIHGFGTEMAGPFNTMRKQCDTSIKLIPYDPEGAKKLLAEAGWKTGSDGVLARDGVRFDFALSLRTGVPLRERMATRIQQWFKQAGIKMAITPYESSVLFQRMDDRNFDAVLAGWGAGGIEEDPNQIWHSRSIDNKGSNYVGFNNPDADKIIDEARRTLDEEKRMALWRKFQRIVYDEQPYTWLFSEVDCAFINGRFKNTQPYPTGLNEGDWYVPLKAQKYR